MEIQTRSCNIRRSAYRSILWHSSQCKASIAILQINSNLDSLREFLLLHRDYLPYGRNGVLGIFGICIEYLKGIPFLTVDTFAYNGSIIFYLIFAEDKSLIEIDLVEGTLNNVMSMRNNNNGSIFLTGIDAEINIVKIKAKKM